MRANSALSRNENWEEALGHVLDQALGSQSGSVDLALLFASAHHQAHYEELVARAYRESGASVLVGCSGQGIIGVEQEVEGSPAISLLTLSVPQATFTPVRVTQQTLAAAHSAEAWHTEVQLEPEAVKGWIVFADPFSMECEHLVAGLGAAYPERPIVGGLASEDHRRQGTHVFLNERAYADGAVAVALSGAIGLRAVVSQGCQPIGEPWIITDAERNIIRTISGRPAYEVLVDTLRSLPPEMQRRARTNLLVGLAIDEYRDSFGRGDFLIRNLMGVDPENGAMAIGAYPRVGQTIQFQLRDAAAADEDLHALLGLASEELKGRRPAAALLCSCNGRGAGLFGKPNHDAEGVAREMGSVPLAGFFCNGEIGPIGQKNFLHGFTASIALLVPEDAG